jgi:hypothetical protein
VSSTKFYFPLSLLVVLFDLSQLAVLLFKCKHLKRKESVTNSYLNYAFIHVLRTYVRSCYDVNCMRACTYVCKRPDASCIFLCIGLSCLLPRLTL